MKKIVFLLAMVLMMGVSSASAEALEEKVNIQLITDALPQLLHEVEQCRAENGKARQACARKINDDLKVFNFIAKRQGIEILPIPCDNTTYLPSETEEGFQKFCLWERIKMKSIKELPVLLRDIEQCKAGGTCTRIRCRIEASNIILKGTGIELLPGGGL